MLAGYAFNYQHAVCVRDIARHAIKTLFLASECAPLLVEVSDWVRTLSAIVVTLWLCVGGSIWRRRPRACRRQATWPRARTFYSCLPLPLSCILLRLFVVFVVASFGYQFDLAGESTREHSTPRSTNWVQGFTMAYWILFFFLGRDALEKWWKFLMIYLQIFAWTNTYPFIRNRLH